MRLADADLLRLLPSRFGKDAQFSAAGNAANPCLNELSRAIPNLLIWARLGGQDPKGMLAPLRRLVEARPGLAPLAAEALESLAWQFHVDFREACRTDSELAGAVLSSIAWHRIKGTPASIKAALALFGFGGIEIDEHDPAMPWATYQLGFEEIASLDDLRLIVRVCAEMQPARCRLWRVYTHDYDFRPGVWSGALPRNAWSHSWWSGYSGAEFPDIPGLGGGLIVSFALTRKFQAEPWAEGPGAAAWREDGQAAAAPIRRYPIWSQAYWGEAFPLRPPFGWAALAPFHGCELVPRDGLFWLDRPWPDSPWSGAGEWDRRLPDWAMVPLATARSQGVYSGATAADCAAGQGCWSGANASWSIPLIELAAEAPRWSAAYWGDPLPEPEIIAAAEQHHEGRSAQAEPFEPFFDGEAEAFGCAALAGAAADGEEFFGWIDQQWPDAPWGARVGFRREQRPLGFSIAEFSAQGA